MGITPLVTRTRTAASLAVAAAAVIAWVGLHDLNRPDAGAPQPTAVTPHHSGIVADVPSGRSGEAHARGPFSLVVHTARGEIRVGVAPLHATIRPDGTAEPIDPPHSTVRQWNTAAWIEQSAYPAGRAQAPTYVYGHACRHHTCAFDRLTDARPGDSIAVRTSSSLVTYRICARGLSLKSGNLAVPACDHSAADLVLVTCLYEHGDESTQNLVVVATLTASENRTR